MKEKKENSETEKIFDMAGTIRDLEHNINGLRNFVGDTFTAKEIERVFGSIKTHLDLPF
jgi:hypothetical protein